MGLIGAQVSCFMDKESIVVRFPPANFVGVHASEVLCMTQPKEQRSGKGTKRCGHERKVAVGNLRDSDCGSFFVDTESNGHVFLLHEAGHFEGDALGAALPAALPHEDLLLACLRDGAAPGMVL